MGFIFYFRSKIVITVFLYKIQNSSFSKFIANQVDMKDKNYHKAYKREYAKTHKNITISVSLEQYEQFQKIAKNEDTKVTTLVRNMAVAYMQQKTLVPSELKGDLAKVGLLIRNIANNVNQIAHNSNRIKSLIDENALLFELKKLEDAVFDYTKKRLDRN